MKGMSVTERGPKARLGLGLWGFYNFAVVRCSEVAGVAAGGFQVLAQCIPVLSGMPGDRSQQHPANPSALRTRSRTLNSKAFDHSALIGTTDAMKAPLTQDAPLYTGHACMARSGVNQKVLVHICMCVCTYEMDG